MNKGLPFDTSFAGWQVLSALLGGSVVAFVFCVGLALTVSEPAEGVAGWLDRLKPWQTLITGIIALIVGFGSILMINRQIMQASQVEQDRIERELYAARIGLPVALNTLHDYVERCASRLQAFQPHLRGTRLEYPDGWVPPDLPDIPHVALETIQTCIAAENGENRDALAYPLRNIQSVSARIKRLREDALFGRSDFSTGRFLNVILVDLCEYKVRIDKTFDYARHPNQEISIDTEVTLDNLQTAAERLGISKEEFPGLEDTMHHVGLKAPIVE